MDGVSKMFDCSCYVVEAEVQANLDLKCFLKDTLLKIDLDSLPDTPTRVQQVDSITEEFYQYFGSYPSSVNLYYLSNYLLQDYLKSPNKKKSDPDAILSRRQQRARYSKEFSSTSALIDVIHTNKVHNFAKVKKQVNFDD